jgi:hypothetical protein
MNSPIVVVPKYHKVGEGFSKAEKLKAFEHKGRQTNPKRGYLSPAGWITELADGRHAILLCSWCRRKFNPRKNKYRNRYVPDPTGKTDGYLANGNCDGCQQRTELMGGGTIFVAEEYWLQIGLDPSEARRRYNQRWKMAQEVSLLQKVLASNSSRKKQNGFTIKDKRRIKT